MKRLFNIIPFFATAIVVTMALLLGCKNNESNNSTELEPGVFLDSKSGVIVSHGCAIVPSAPDCICSFYCDSVCISYMKLPTSYGIGIQFFNFNDKPSDTFTIKFDNGKNVRVKQSSVKGDGRYMVAIEESNPIFRDFYDGLMTSNECSIFDAYPNRKFVFQTGGFNNLVKYLK